MKSLNEIPIGTKAIITHIDIDNIKHKSYLYDLGLCVNTAITAMFASPCGDPKAYFVKNSLIGLRNEDAKNIKVKLYTGDNYEAQ